MHKSVGAIIKQSEKFLLMDRKIEPFGFAGVAGHIDENETPEQTLKREVKEESGLDVISQSLLFEEMVEWNECSEGIRGHYWYIFDCKVSGELKPNPEEAKSIGWYTIEQIKKLKLEPVWEYWFKKLGII